VKILQNKYFVILLAVFAFGLLGRNLLWPIVKRRFPARAAAAAPASTPPAASAKQASSAPAKSNSAAATASLKQTKPEVRDDSTPAMNILEAAASAPRWSQHPRRDPFKMAGGRSDGKAARDLLTLSGVLRQTQSTLAVLNNQVLTAGDIILGFKIETVEDRCVWVTGPNGREQVEFKYSLPPAPQARQAVQYSRELYLAEPSR
jgi:hypothetical protein